MYRKPISILKLLLLFLKIIFKNLRCTTLKFFFLICKSETVCMILIYKVNGGLPESFINFSRTQD